MRVAVICLLCIILAVNLYLITAQLTDKNNLPKIFGFAAVIVISGSMEPAIEAGDLIIIKEQGEYKEDDIVTYRSGPTLITHRIVAINASEVITRGDANNAEDAPVVLSALEGKVVLNIPEAGKFLLFLKTPTGILTASCLVLVCFFLARAVQKLKREKKTV